jgi:hypothetical protein
VAFDFAPGAIEEIRRRHPASTVAYHVADLLAGSLRGVDRGLRPRGGEPDHPVAARSFRTEAIDRGTPLGRARRTLLVISGIADDWEDGPDGPWPLTRAEIESFAADGLDDPVRLETPPGIDGSPRWRANSTAGGDTLYM